MGALTQHPCNKTKYMSHESILSGDFRKVKMWCGSIPCIPSLQRRTNHPLWLLQRNVRPKIVMTEHHRKIVYERVIIELYHRVSLPNGLAKLIRYLVSHGPCKVLCHKPAGGTFPPVRTNEKWLSNVCFDECARDLSLCVVSISYLCPVEHWVKCCNLINTDRSNLYHFSNL